MSNDCFGSVLLRQRSMTGGLEVDKTYDLIVAVLSWEQRATYAFLSSPAIVSDITAIWFESTSPEIEDRKESQYRLLCSHFKVVNAARLAVATDVEGNYLLFQQIIEERYSQLRRPLKVLIDISCLPKNYLLFLLGLGFSNDYFACFDCVYSAGQYDLLSDAADEADEAGRIHRALVSAGDWTARQVPFFGGRDVFPKTKDLVVSVGGELGLTVPFVVKAEPRKLTLIFIQETAPSEHAEMLESERSAYRTLMSEPSVVSAEFGLNDSLGVANFLQDCANASDADCVSLMVLGSKSHAIAVGLVGLANERVEVVCRVPKSYRRLDVLPAGGIFLYQIEDRFEPLNYLDPR